MYSILYVCVSSVDVYACVYSYNRDCLLNTIIKMPWQLRVKRFFKQLNSCNVVDKSGGKVSDRGGGKRTDDVYQSLTVREQTNWQL